MSTINRLVPWLCVPAAVALTAWVCTAAPILPAKPRVTEEIKSLAGIKRLRVVVESKSLLLQNMKYSPANIQEQVSDLMIEAGFEVVDKREKLLPILRFEFMSASDPKFEKAAGFCVVMALRQPVDLRRFELSMYASTYQSFYVGLESRGDLNEKITTGVESRVKQFIDHQLSAGQTPD